MRVIGSICSVLLLCSCGTGSNFNQIWGGHDDGGDSKLLEAQAAYDSKDYETAEKLSRELLARNPDNEAAAIMLGYTMLSIGGIEPIALARKLIGISSDKKAAEPTGNNLLQVQSQQEGSATSSLSQLGDLVSVLLSPEDFDALSERPFDAAANGNKEPALFGVNRPLLIPAKVSDDLRSKVHILKQMNEAVKAVCRFVDVETKGDAVRHETDDCAPTTAQRHKKAKAHFLWAFSHLTEALVYQSVILYSSATNGVSNFQSASDYINTENYGTDIGRFVNEVMEMKNAVDVVFDTAASDSMIRATLVNLETVNKAFSAIAGLPDGITEKISQSLDQINKVATDLGQAGVEGNTNALKGQMTEKFTKVVGEKIEKVAESTPILSGKTYEDVANDSAIPTPQKQEVLGQVAAMCNSYDSLATGLPPEKNKKPNTCVGVPAQ